MSRPELDLENERPASSLKSGGHPAKWIIPVLLLLVGAGVVYWYWPKKDAPPQAVTEPPAAPPTQAAPAVNQAEGDSLLHALLTSPPASELLRPWMEGPGLVRRLVAVVTLIADGESPAPLLPFLAPETEFAEKHKRKPRGRNRRPPKEVVFITDQSYKRYDKVTDIVSSVDAAAVGRAYGSLQPYFEAAYSEIGKPGRTFDQVLRQAVSRLRSVPVIEGPIRLQPEGLFWAYENQELESKTRAEKQLLRMGPRNIKLVQQKLKDFEDALASQQ